MYEQHNKRGSIVLENGEHGRSGKKPRPAHAVVKQEVEEGEVLSQGSEGERAMTAVEEIDEPQINLRMTVSLFHCGACFRPLKPPTFKNYVLMMPISESYKYFGIAMRILQLAHHDIVIGLPAMNEVVNIFPIYRRAKRLHAVRGQTPRVQHLPRQPQPGLCRGGHAFLQDAKLPCAYKEFGCESYVVYHEAADHLRACPWAPCSCPDHGCPVFTSPARLLEQLGTHHSWPVTGVSYGKPCKLPVPPPQGWHVLVGGEDRCVFLVSASALGTATAVSLVCVRANGDAAAGAPQFECMLRESGRRPRAAADSGCAAMIGSAVRSSSLVSRLRGG
ncbi:hypothetical protein C2845_PM07G02600 [Panicum miliaceum]|uniref:SIAH-type domain-containing protein n=1 Tax=Panicum miliaceum TaxID=4540 RepID=A0A3L6SUI3_PANMI|nr:hypothetical protein C2845_PM07G02600 [Panicum miliaceum]